MSPFSIWDTCPSQQFLGSFLRFYRLQTVPDSADSAIAPIFKIRCLSYLFVQSKTAKKIKRKVAILRIPPQIWFWPSGESTYNAWMHSLVSFWNRKKTVRNWNKVAPNRSTCIRGNIMKIGPRTWKIQPERCRLPVSWYWVVFTPKILINCNFFSSLLLKALKRS